MSPTDVPKRLTIDLARFQQEGLAEIADRLPLEDVHELLSVVISRGIVEILNSPILPPPSGQVSENMRPAEDRVRKLGSKVAVPAKLRASAQMSDPGTSDRVPFGMKQSLDELHVQEAERDREMARMTRDLGLAEAPEGKPPRDRQVENYIGVFLPEGLRQAVESSVNAYPDVDEEHLYAALLEIGLKKVQEDPKALAPWATAQWAGAPPLGSKEASRDRFRAKWVTLCGSVARGWR